MAVIPCARRVVASIARRGGRCEAGKPATLIDVYVNVNYPGVSPPPGGVGADRHADSDSIGRK